MSRIKPVLKSTSKKDDLNIGEEEPPFYVVVTWGVFMVLIILTIQYLWEIKVKLKMAKSKINKLV